MHMRLMTVAGAVAAAAGLVRAEIGSSPGVLSLRMGAFDPSVSVPAPPRGLEAVDGSELVLVQLAPGPVGETLEAVRGLGGLDYGYVPLSGRVVRIRAERMDELRRLPQVRWVGPYHAWYKLDGEVAGDQSGERVRHSVMMWERGPEMAGRVAARVRALGGLVLRVDVAGLRLDADLTGEQARELARMDDVWFIDRPGPVGVDVDIARAIGGGNFVQQTLGMTGVGVRAEVMDTMVRTAHTEFVGHQILWHGPTLPQDSWHGTRVFGIMFSKGVNPQARGFLPDAQPIFAHLDPYFNNTSSRYVHTAQLVDPIGPYRAVLQTNSWGHSWSTLYTTISAEMDDILFINDILVTQSQSNLANTSSRPEAWAKNIVSVGGVVHFDTLSRADDCWNCNTTTVPAASTGPAVDGRIKPDLAHFYDRTFTTAENCNTCYEPGFYGTSNATPLTAGHFGLFFEMWHRGVFAGHGGAASVFDSRAHMTTAKAAMINSAYRYDWSSGGPNGDLSRMRQGWGMPDLKKLYDGRGSTLIIDETDVLLPQQTATYRVRVGAGEPEFRATMTWADPMGNPAASVHRINDLSLRVTSPGGTVYWGNQGLTAGNWSAAGGAADTINTVENVFVRDPAAGEWMVEVIASEINVDGRTQTPGLDADFALVVSGVGGACYANCDGSTLSPVLNINDFSCFLNRFAASEAYANCDGSTSAPVLNVNDFVCFLNAYAGGCP